MKIGKEYIKFKLIYECNNINCIANELYSNTNYEIKLFCFYGDEISDLIKIYKIEIKGQIV